MLRLQFINGTDGQVPYDGHYDLGPFEPIPKVGEYILDSSRRFVVLRITYDYSRGIAYVNLKREEAQ